MHLSTLVIATAALATSRVLAVCKLTAYASLQLAPGPAAQVPLDIGVNPTTNHLVLAKPNGGVNATVFDFYACPHNYTGLSFAFVIRISMLRISGHT